MGRLQHLLVTQMDHVKSFKKFSSKLRFDYGCVLTGINTVLKDNPFFIQKSLLGLSVAKVLIVISKYDFKKSNYKKNNY